MREYERTGRLEHLERAISLFRQEVLEQGADGGESVRWLTTALRLRSDHTGQRTDLDEATKLNHSTDLT